MQVSTIESGKTVSMVNDFYLKEYYSTYELCFPNIKYQYSKQWSCITFNKEKNDLEEFRQIVNKGFDNFSKDITKVEFNGQTIWISYEKILGTILVNFSKLEYNVLVSVSENLTKKQFDKLINKVTKSVTKQ